MKVTKGTKHTTVFTLDTQLPFGKYKGETVREVLDTDVNYIQWCFDNVAGFTLDEAAFKKFERNMEEEQERRAAAIEDFDIDFPMEF